MKCASCSVKIKTDASFDGSKKFRCPKCNTILKVSSFDPEATIVVIDTPPLAPPIATPHRSPITLSKQPKKRRTTSFATPLMLSVAFLCGVGATLLVSPANQPANEPNGLVAAEKREAPAKQKGKPQPEKAKPNLLGLSAPSIQSATWEYSSQFNKNFTASNLGVTFEIRIENPTASAIEAMSFYVELRKEGRTVPMAYGQFSGLIAGGVEPGRIEQTTWFAGNDQVGRDGMFDFPEDCDLYLAITRIDYYGRPEREEIKNPVLFKAVVKNAAKRFENPNGASSGLEALFQKLDEDAIPKRKP